MGQNGMITKTQRMNIRDLYDNPISGFSKPYQRCQLITTATCLQRTLQHGILSHLFIVRLSVVAGSVLLALWPIYSDSQLNQWSLA